jgi:hypothetical protein
MSCLLFQLLQCGGLTHDELFELDDLGTQWPLKGQVKIDWLAKSHTSYLDRAQQRHRSCDALTVDAVAAPQDFQRGPTTSES